MQIGTDRSGRRHGVGQPEMERELGRLGEGTQQHQYQCDRVGRVFAQGIATGQNHAKIVAANNIGDQQQAGQQCQTAGAGDGQRHAGTLAGVTLVVPETDQQEGADAGQLPEQPQLNQVVGRYYAHHRCHEQDQIGIKT